MGSCSNCKKKILYNKYKRYRKQILCRECYDTRLERKKAKKQALKAQAEALKIETKKDIKNEDSTPLEDINETHEKWAKEDNEDDTEKTSEDTR